MNSSDIVLLYEQGHSIEYIINAYYYYKKSKTKNIQVLFDKRILILNRETVRKRDCRYFVEKTIHDYLVKKC